MHSLDAKDLSTGHNLDPLLARDGVGNLGSELGSVHEEEVDLTDVVNKHDLVAGGDHVTGLLVGTETVQKQ